MISLKIGDTYWNRDDMREYKVLIRFDYPEKNRTTRVKGWVMSTIRGKDNELSVLDTNVDNSFASIWSATQKGAAKNKIRHLQKQIDTLTIQYLDGVTYNA